MRGLIQEMLAEIYRRLFFQSVTAVRQRRQATMSVTFSPMDMKYMSRQNPRECPRRGAICPCNMFRATSWAFKARQQNNGCGIFSVSVF